MTFEPEISWKRTGVFVFFAIFEASNLGDTDWNISTSFPFSFNWLIKVLKLMGIWISESCQMIKRLSDKFLRITCKKLACKTFLKKLDHKPFQKRFDRKSVAVVGTFFKKA
ncbi:hypothetical protein MSKOL_0298 [Methanosarcina sp. Kolksee]|uniref:hypothetical protein n=1 Tax=Methanosarcina sp. Kolksee TaxID=1434099 RepID=UPI0006160D25|nr:hypothetical protein [Methanosarcina sp. Kolksee]AKB46075.1 hypothetical protein MSKOL_0298 [Methanosarcina sp. Kolksee]